MLVKSVIQTEIGNVYNTIRFLNSGGEAFLYEVEQSDTGERKVLKVFKNKFDPHEKEKRIRFLMNLKLEEESSQIIVPQEIYKENGQVGYIMDFVPGMQLIEFLCYPKFTFKEGLHISLDLCKAVEALHRKNIAYGDLNHKNIMINQTGSSYEVYCLDMDNYYSPGSPPSSMAGQRLSMPPEFYQDMENNKKITPNKKSDMFSLSVVLMEIILLTSPAVGSDSSEEDIKTALSQPWRLDPIFIDPQTNPYDNYPVGVLSSDLISLFRRGINPDINNRPTVYEWIYSLENALSRIYTCPICHYPTIIDSSKTTCPLGTHPFEQLGLKVGTSRNEILFDKPSMVIGRSLLNGSKKVSSYHLHIEKYGPQVRMKSVGRNGTFRWNGYSWTQLPHNKPILIKKNDKLKIADVEVEIISVN